MLFPTVSVTIGEVFVITLSKISSPFTARSDAPYRCAIMRRNFQSSICSLMAGVSNPSSAPTVMLLA